jgi:DNA adenine methylase
MGHSTVGAHRRTGYRTNVRYVRRSAPAGDWQRLVDHIELVTTRLRGVNIENRPAIEVIQGHDTPETFFYVDPPYPFSTRHGKVYTHEMNDDQHRELAKVLQSVKGMVVISGYACDLYDLELYPIWQRLERIAYADKGLERTEVLWINPAAQKALDSTVRQHDMFAPRPTPAQPSGGEGANERERAEEYRSAVDDMQAQWDDVTRRG